MHYDHTEVDYELLQLTTIFSLVFRRCKSTNRFSGICFFQSGVTIAHRFSKPLLLVDELL
jgi:hypothetical protein